MTIKIAVGSYHTFYVDNCDDIDEATDLVLDKLRSVSDSDASDRMRTADCETTVDFAVSID